MGSWSGRGYSCSRIPAGRRLPAVSTPIGLERQPPATFGISSIAIQLIMFIPDFRVTNPLFELRQCVNNLPDGFGSFQLDLASWKVTRSETVARARENPKLEADFHVKVRPLENHVMQASIRNGAFTILADEPVRRGGEDKAPSMMEYFLAGLAMTQCAQLLWNAAEMDIPVDSIELELSGGFLLSGWAGLSKSNGLSKASYTARIETPATSAQVQELAARAFARCPAVNSITNPVPMNGVIFCNGKEVARTG